MRELKKKLGRSSDSSNERGPQDSKEESSSGVYSSEDEVALREQLQLLNEQ